MLTMKSYVFLLAKYLTLLVCTFFIGCGGGTSTTASTNAAPTANPGLSQNVLVGAVVSMDGSGSKDPEASPLSFKWALIGKPNGSAASLTSFPTLNQNTTGSAATLTTPRAIYGNNFDGSAALTQIITST
jgi:hypothetical protein